jgi:hypothetical protein
VDGTVLRNNAGHPAQHPHSARDGCTVRVCRIVPGSDFQAMSEERRGGDFPLTLALAMCQGL